MFRLARAVIGGVGSGSVHDRRAKLTMRERTNYLWALLALAALLQAGGCAKSDGVTVPTYDPSGSANKALELFDENKNSAIDGSELAKCPGLQAAMPRVDQDGNGKLTANEISARVSQYQTQSVGMMSLTCKVTYNGQPLPGAKITFVPEEFMSKVLKPATGTANVDGQAGLTTEGAPVGGIQVGLYRIQVSLPDAAGQESLPARFNTESTLGAEVALDVPQLERGLKLDLK
jgi:hypothetical protein